MAAVATATKPTPSQTSAMSSPFDIAPGEGVDEVMGALFSDAIGSAVPEIGAEDSWREVGDMERNTPPANPGCEQLWVRGWYADGKPDVKNLTRIKRKGWVPRTPDPKDHAAYSVLALGDRSVISVNGMILMERPTEIGDKFRAVNRQRIAVQSAGANLDEHGVFDDRLGRMFGSVKSVSRTGRDAADLIDN